MSDSFDRMITIAIKDGNDDPLRNCCVEWLVNNAPVGRNIGADGHAELILQDPSGTVSIRVSYIGCAAKYPKCAMEYPGCVTQSITLAPDQTHWEFIFPNVFQNPKWKDFSMKHFPAIVGIAFVLLALATALIFKQPSPLQTHIVLALFALGGGGFGGEIAGFIKADIKFGEQLVISAGGAAAIFALLFFFVPAGS